MVESRDDLASHTGAGAVTRSLDARRSRWAPSDRNGAQPGSDGHNVTDGAVAQDLQVGAWRPDRVKVRRRRPVEVYDGIQLRVHETPPPSGSPLWFR